MISLERESETASGYDTSIPAKDLRSLYSGSSAISFFWQVPSAV